MHHEWRKFSNDVSSEAYNLIYGGSKVASQTSPQILAQAASYKSMKAFDALATKPGDKYASRTLLSAISKKEVDELERKYRMSPQQLEDTRKLARLSAMAIIGN